MVKSKDELVGKMPWVSDYSDNTIKLIGAAEILGAIAMVAPMLMHQFEMLTPIAAICLGVVMLLAANLHINRGESDMIVVNAALAILCAFVAYGRWGFIGA